MCTLVPESTHEQRQAVGEKVKRLRVSLERFQYRTGFILLTRTRESRGLASPEQERSCGCNYSREKRMGSVGMAILPEFSKANAV